MTLQRWAGNHPLPSSGDHVGVSKTARQGSDGAAGAGAGGRAGGAATGGVAGSTGGGGGAAGQGEVISAGAAGGAAGAPDLGPRGTDGFAVKVELASDIKATAPTTVGIVWWSLAQAGLTEAHIAFGLDTTYGMTAPVDLTRASYRTVLVGMNRRRRITFASSRPTAHGPTPATIGRSRPGHRPASRCSPASA